MKQLIPTLAIAFSFPISFVHAASPDAEAAFISAVKDAFSKHDAGALVALSCWDQAPAKLKAGGKQQYARIVSASGPAVADIKLVAPDPKPWSVDEDPRLIDVDPGWMVAGLTYQPNLPIEKDLVVKFAPMNAGGGNTMTVTVTYPVGEKDGAYYLVEPAPEK